MSANLYNVPNFESYEISRGKPGEVCQFFKSHLTYTAACGTFERVRIEGYSAELWGLTDGDEPELLKHTGGSK